MSKNIRNERNSPEELPTIVDPTVPLPVLAATYEGFGQGIRDLAAAASIGLRIPLPPLYVGGGILALVYAYLKLREAQNRVALRRDLILARRRALETDHHPQYWSAVGPVFTHDQEPRDLTWIMNNLNANQIAECLGYYYRLIVYGAKRFEFQNQLEGNKIRELRELTYRLALRISAEAAQLRNAELSKILNSSAGLTYEEPSDIGALSYLKQAWFNLRKYYKSILTGAATAGGLTVVIIESALSTATLTMLFPWSILIILGALVAGGITGFILDKYLDRHHKNEMQRINEEAVDEQNCKRLGNLWVDLNHTLIRIEEAVPGLSTLNQSDQFNSEEFEAMPVNPELGELPDLLPALDYSEVRTLKQPSHIKRKIADFILPTLIAARVSFGAVSTVFAGLALAGLMLPWWPVVIIGGSMLGIYILFKVINNRIKHQSEEQRIEAINSLISAEKYRYWNSELKRDDIVRYAKENDNQKILSDLRDQYTGFLDYLKKFEAYKNNPEYAQMIQELSTLHHQLLMRYRTHADNLSDKDRQTALYGLAVTAPPRDQKNPEIVTIGSKIKNVFIAIDAFLVRNLKDIVTGFAFGFGTTLTIFAFMGLTSSLLAVWPLAIIAGACFAGIGIRVAIRYGIKAFRNQRLLDINIHGEKQIQDKEQLLDCQAATAAARVKVSQITSKWFGKQDEVEVASTPLSDGFRLTPVPLKSCRETSVRDFKSKSSRPRPLLWIEKSGSNNDLQPVDSFSETHTIELASDQNSLRGR